MVTFDPPRTVGEEVHTMMSMSRTLGCIQWSQLGHPEGWKQWVTCVDKAIEFADAKDLEAAIECFRAAQDLEEAHPEFTPMAHRVIEALTPISNTYRLNQHCLQEAVHTG
jgi:hypothetical protein